MLPGISIGVHEVVWHGAACLRAGPHEHLCAIEDVAEAMGVDVKRLCAKLGSLHDRRLAAILDDRPPAARLCGQEKEKP